MFYFNFKKIQMCIFIIISIVKSCYSLPMIFFFLKVTYDIYYSFEAVHHNFIRREKIISKFDNILFLV